ncbi:MAG: glucosamine-6-phosphate deaminase [Alphaproteobacteria bacterium]
MKVLIKDSEELAIADTARRLAEQVRHDPRSTLGLATGGTMTPVYLELARLHREEGLSFAGITSFNLDEYVGLSPQHPQSYRQDMEQRLFAHVDIAAERTHLPAGDADDPEAEAEAYEKKVEAAGGIDLQLLGIGENGHIGFNEPSSSLGSSTRIKRLAPSTIAANRRFFEHGEPLPTHAITVGIGTIMRAKNILMLAIGEKKAEAVRAMVEGPVSAFCPASALQYHPKVTLLLDPAAASALALRDFYLDIHPHGEDRDLL